MSFWDIFLDTPLLTEYKGALDFRERQLEETGGLGALLEEGNTPHCVRPANKVAVVRADRI